MCKHSFVYCFRRVAYAVGKFSYTICQNNNVVYNICICTTMTIFVMQDSTEFLGGLTQTDY